MLRVNANAEIRFADRDARLAIEVNDWATLDRAEPWSVRDSAAERAGGQHCFERNRIDTAPDVAAVRAMFR